MGNDDEALWGRDAAVLLPIEPTEPAEPTGSLDPAEHPELAPSPSMHRSRRHTVLIVIGTITLVAVGVAVLGRATRTPTPGEVKVPVRHERFTVTINPALQCDPRRTLGPTAVQTMVIDTWTDVTRRRVRNTITYTDASRYDLIATGNISLPSAAVERGVRADVAVGCRGSDGTPIAVVTPPDLPFALDFSLQVTPEQRSAFAHFHQQAQDAGPVTGTDGHLVNEWTALTRGTWAVDAGTTLAGHQSWEWWIGRDDPHSVRLQRFTNTVDHLGTAMRVESLDLSQDTMVTAAFFDTTGFRRVVSPPSGRDITRGGAGGVSGG